MKNSLGLFNAVKGVLMILIILSHSLTDFIFSKMPHAFLSGDIRGLILFFFYLISYAAMPLFFAVCGYGFRRRRLDLLIRNSLAIPLKAYCLASLVIIGLGTLGAFLSGDNAVQALLTGCVSYLFGLQPGATFRGIFFDGNGPLWFLWTFSGAVLLLNQIAKLDKRRIQTAVCAFLACAGLFLTRYPLPFCLQQIFICTGFMYIGWIMSREKILEKKLPWYLAAAAVLSAVLLIFKSGLPVSVSGNEYPNGLPDLIAAWLLSFVLMFPAARLGTCSGPLADFLCWTGRNAFFLCCFHTVEFKALPLRYFINFHVQNRYLRYTVLFLASSLWAFGTVYAFTRCRQGFRKKTASGRKQTGSGGKHKRIMRRERERTDLLTDIG